MNFDLPSAACCFSSSDTLRLVVSCARNYLISSDLTETSLFHGMGFVDEKVTNKIIFSPIDSL